MAPNNLKVSSRHGVHARMHSAERLDQIRGYPVELLVHTPRHLSPADHENTDLGGEELHLRFISVVSHEDESMTTDLCSRHGTYGPLDSILRFDAAFLTRGPAALDRATAPRPEPGPGPPGLGPGPRPRGTGRPAPRAVMDRGVTSLVLAIHADPRPRASTCGCNSTRLSGRCKISQGGPLARCP